MDGNLNISVNVTDYANNIAKSNSTIYKDTVLPIVTDYTPSNNTKGVSVDTNLTLTFNKDIISVFNGILKINQIDPNTNESIEFMVVDVNDSRYVSTEGNKSIINGNYDLAYGNKYFITIDQGAYQDIKGNKYNGISSNSTWIFETNTSSGPCECATLDNCDLPPFIQSSYYKPFVTTSSNNIKYLNKDSYYNTISLAGNITNIEENGNITLKIDGTVIGNTVVNSNGEWNVTDINLSTFEDG